MEDVLVRIDTCYFPVDFLILDMEPAQKLTQTPIILGRPFLATAKANIDCAKGTMDISVGDQKISLNIFQASQNMRDSEDCFAIDVLENLVEEACSLNQPEDLTENDFELNFREEEPHPTTPKSLERLHPKSSFPSTESQPPLELKPLPDSLKYVFLGPNQTLPVIIAANLTQDQEAQLTNVLRDHQTSIGWSINDLKGISPSLCMHHIYTDVDAKPIRDMQRRLNPNMREVVKREVIKWLDAGIIYPISDSRWVSPTQVVPKKSGLTVVQSDRGELLPTRLTTGWRVCVDYRKLNIATKKDHFSLPFMDQILERLAG